MEKYFGEWVPYSGSSAIILGSILFMLMPNVLIGWIILPIGTAVTLWVLLRQIKSEAFSYFCKISLIWVLIAILFDYLFLVQFLKPADGYYKLDVYVYYILVFLLPLLVSWGKSTYKI
ncbi:hypothetical protein M1563_00780 [Patescibacteria group bacterium]|nr:hypothetical protein [Patescibacteria group bacterium]MCL5410150.1 hypothetical protein [Patescibacteria group bacterium]